MFADIDKDGNGNLSVMEYTRWKNKHNKPIKLDKFLDKVEDEKNKKPKKIAPKVKTDADDSKLNETKPKPSDDCAKIIKSLNAKIASLIKINDNLLAENRANQKEEANLKQKLEALHKENKNIKQQNKEIKAENGEFQKDKISKKAELNNLKLQLSNFEMNIKLKDEEIERLNTQIASKQDTKDSDYLREQIEKLKAANEELNEQIDSQNKKIKDLKKENSKISEENDENAINLKTKTAEIVLLKEKINVINSGDDNKLKQLRLEAQSLNDDILRQKKEIKRLKTQNDEYEQEIESIEKEKRKIKSSLNEKDGQITILSHKLELIEHRKELESAPTNDQITKLKQSNQELEDENLQKTLTIKALKEQLGDLQNDLDKEKEQIIGLKVQINQAEASSENAEKLRQIDADKYLKEIEQLGEDKQSMKVQIIELNESLQEYILEAAKNAKEKKIINEAVTQERNDETKSELDALKIKFKALTAEMNENEQKHKEQSFDSEAKIKLLQAENERLHKKVQKEQNHLDIVLRADIKRIEKEKEMERQRVVKVAVLIKHDLSKLNVQIEILNSELFRMKSLMLLAKYEKVDNGKYYGFLDFVQKDLSDDALKNVCSKLKISDKISVNKVAPLLNVIVKIYTMRLHKLKTGETINRREYKNDRRVIEHFGVWLLRSKSKKTDKLESVSVLDDCGVIIRGEYAVFNGQISMKEFHGLFAQWCKEYVECNGCHSDSKLK